MRTQWMVLFVLVLLCVCASMAHAEGRQAQGDVIVPAFEQFVAAWWTPETAGLMCVVGREATGAGPCMGWMIGKGSDTYLDLGLIQSNAGSRNVIPGISYSPPLQGAPVDVKVGLAATSAEYGGVRLGPVRVSAVSPYFALSKAF